jgi:choice-of-anchor A domain-containing protein
MTLRPGVPCSLVLAALCLSSAALASPAVSGTASLANAGGLVAVDSSDGRVFVTSQGANAVYVFEDDLTAVTTLSVSAPFAVAVDPRPASHRVWVSSYATGKVSALDPGTGALFCSVSVGGGAVALDLDIEGDLLWVAAEGSRVVRAIDIDTCAIRSTTSLGLKPNAVAVDTVRDRVYVSIHHENKVAVLDRDGGALLTTVSLAGGDPIDIDVNPDTNRVWVGYLSASRVTEIDPGSDGTGPFTLTEHSVGPSTVTLAVDPLPDRTHVAVRGTARLVTVTDGAIDSSVSLGGFLSDVAVDTDSHCAFVATRSPDRLVKVCDADIDGDGVVNVDDDCPFEDPDTYLGYGVGADGCISDLVGAACPTARAIRDDDTDFNDMADEWGVLARGDATLDGASQGALRVFGDGDLGSFNLGSSPINGYSYAGKGELYARSGSFARDVRARTVDVDTTVSIGGSTTASSLDGHIADYMRALSDDLADQEINGDTNVFSWGAIALEGTHPMLNTFEIAAADFAAATSMTVNVPDGSAVLVNVRGATADFGPGVTLSGVDATGVVYNFPDATSLTLDGAGVHGQVLAPYADVDLVSGSITGTLTGLSLDGTIAQVNAPFAGRACATVEAKPAPSCEITHTVTGSWPSGYNASVTITNLGPGISSWTAGWTFGNGESVSSGWGGTWTQAGAAVSVANAGWNGVIASGASRTIGYTGAGTPTAPVGFTLNGAACE